MDARREGVVPKCMGLGVVEMMGSHGKLLSHETPGGNKPATTLLFRFAQCANRNIFLFLQVHFAALRQILGSAYAQVRDNCQAQDEPYRAERSGQTEGVGGGWDELGENRED